MKGVLFQDSMVQAILAGQKSVTRRVGESWSTVAAGDRLWVRETWRTEELDSGLDGVRFRADNAFVPIEPTKAAAERWVHQHSRSAGRSKHGRWRPSIHMPFWACRLRLVVESVTTQRTPMATVVDDAEALLEGFPSAEAFLALWVALHPNYDGVVYRVAFRRLAPDESDETEGETDRFEVAS